MQHTKGRLPERAETLRSLLLVKPGQHRAHHATDVRHHDTNFGTLLSLWDRLFTTLGLPLPLGPAAPTLGLADIRRQRFARPDGALVLPWLVRRSGSASAPARGPEPAP